MYTEEQLNDALEHTHCNKTELLNSEKIGCYSCMRIFTTKESDIDSFPSTFDVDEKNRTMICPHCYVDALIGDASGYKITEGFLYEMNSHWLWMEYDDDYDEDDCDDDDCDDDARRKQEKAIESILSGLGKTIEEFNINFFNIASTLIHNSICKCASSGWINTPEDVVKHIYVLICDWCKDRDYYEQFRTIWESSESELVNYAKSLQDEAREICIKQADRRSQLYDLFRERLKNANFPLDFINNSYCNLRDEVVQVSIYFSKTHYLDVEVAAKDFEDSLGSIVVSALALSEMKNITKVRVVQEEWDKW